MVPAIVVALSAAAVCLGALAASRLRVDPVALQACSGGVLLALILAEALPDSLRNTRGTGLHVLVVLAVAAGYGLLRLAGRPPRDRAGVAVPHGPLGRAGAVGLIGHGIVEGAVVGLGFGLDARLGWVFLAGFVGHKAGEGFALSSSLRSGRRSGATVIRYVAACAAAPTIGALLGALVAIPQPLEPLLVAAFAGVLAGVAQGLVQPILRRPDVLRLAGLAGLGAALMGAITVAAG